MSRRRTPPPPRGKPAPRRDTPARRWCFTEFNVEAIERMTDNAFANSLSEQIRYMVFQKEECETTKRLHLQGYVELTKPQRFTWVKANISATARWAKANGNRDQAREYCMKEDTRIEGPWEFGDFGAGGQGKRTDLHEACEMLIETGSLHQLARQHPTSFVKYHRGFNELLKKVKPPVTEVVYSMDDFNTEPISQDILSKFAVILYGDTNTGKTSYAISHFKNPLLVSHMDVLGSLDPTFHDGIVFDDMSFVKVPPGAKIHLTDLEQNRDVQIRYVTAFLPKGFPRIFTYNTEGVFYDHENMIDYRQKDAIDRRCHYIHITEPLFNDYTGLGSDIDSESD